MIKSKREAIEIFTKLAKNINYGEKVYKKILLNQVSENEKEYNIPVKTETGITIFQINKKTKLFTGSITVNIDQ